MQLGKQTVADAVQIFDGARYPNGLTASTAWLGIYQTLLWYEPVNLLGFDELLHIIDADKLRPASSEDAWSRVKAWQSRAHSVHAYLAQRLGCPASEVKTCVDLLMKLPNYRRKQRQNPLGAAFVGLAEHVLSRFGSQFVLYETEVKASSIFAGITFPGRSTTPRMDILARRNGIPRAIISAKWSLRHDRVNDITNECPVYKAAYQRIYRQPGLADLRYYVITNEYDPARLNKMLHDTCVDGVVHVHKPVVVEVCGLDGRLAQMMDLEDFVTVTASW